MIAYCIIPQLNAEVVLHKCHMFVLEKLKRLIITEGQAQDFGK